MKATNFKQAAQMSLDDRWNKIVKAKTCQEMLTVLNETKCELCKLQERRGHHPAASCGRCPMGITNDGTYNCCQSYEEWLTATAVFLMNKPDYPKALEAAQGVVKRLEAIANGE